MLTPIVPLGWLALAVDRASPARVRAVLLLWFGAFFLFYCFYFPYGDWLSTRFLIPGIPALVLAFLLVLRDASDRWKWRPAVIAVVLLFVVGYAVRRDVSLKVLGVDEDQAVHRESCLWAAERLPEKAAVVAVEMSGALLFYTRLVPVRYDRIRPEEFPRLRERVEAAGYRWFALIMPHEAKVAAAAVPGEWTFLGEQGPMSLWRLEPEPRRR